MNRNYITSTIGLAVTLVVYSGCGQNNQSTDHGQKPGITMTSSTDRATRRAFEGAPPVIPHKMHGASCIECHSKTGKAIPDTGFAPANPHLITAGMGLTANCRQCHVYRNTDDTFTQNLFVGASQDLRKGDRLFAGAPPAVPHPEFMRENCQACHSGPSARPEIRCDHPARTNCRQCHVVQVSASLPLGQKE